MWRTNRLLALIVLLAIIGIVSWFFIPGASMWISNNLSIVLTILAVIILAFVGIRFLMEKINSASRRTADIILIVIAVGSLFWIYAVPILPAWVKQSWYYFLIGIVVVGAGYGISIVVRNRIRQTRYQKEKKHRVPIPVETQRQVFSRADYRCQWKDCREKRHLEIHHVDDNPANNDFNNLICLCPNHHKRSQRKEVRSWLLHDWMQGKYY